MKMFSNCSGSCCICSMSTGGCLAGHGDDDFALASYEELIRRLSVNYRHGEEEIKNALITYFEVPEEEIEGIVLKRTQEDFEKLLLDISSFRLTVDGMVVDILRDLYYINLTDDMKVQLAVRLTQLKIDCANSVDCILNKVTP